MLAWNSDLVVRQGHLVGKWRRTGAVGGLEKVCSAKGTDSCILTLTGCSEKVADLALVWWAHCWLQQ